MKEESLLLLSDLQKLINQVVLIDYTIIILGGGKMIDARGYSCPMPVVMVQNEVKKNAPDTLDVLVDSQTCVENVTRFGEKQGYTVSCASEGGDFRLTLRK